MTLSEQLAMVICGGPEYAVRQQFNCTKDRLPDDADAPVEMPTRCVCMRDGRTPSMRVVRCAGSLAKADAAIGMLERLGLIIVKT